MADQGKQLHPADAARAVQLARQFGIRRAAKILRMSRNTVRKYSRKDRAVQV